LVFHHAIKDKEISIVPCDVKTISLLKIPGDNLSSGNVFQLVNFNSTDVTSSAV
jgi:hypothetical protein